MKALEYNRCLKIIGEWASENEGFIKHIWPQKGGWESWVQVEIYRYFVKKNHLYDISREQHVYKNSMKSADLVINKGIDEARNIIIEIKCQSFENRSNFCKGLLDDINKLNNDLSPDFRGSYLVVIGFYFENDLLLPEGFYSEIIGNGEIGICCWTSNVE